MFKIKEDEFTDAIKNIALPVALQNLLFISLNFVDMLMVGRLGKIPFSAVGLGGQYYFVMNLTTVGIASACQIYMSQYWGNNDKKEYRKAVGAAIFGTFLIAMLFAIGAWFYPQHILSFFSKDKELIETGVGYLRIIGFQMPLIAIVLPLATASRCAQNAKLPLKISMVSLVSNTILNYLLIFGKFGFPRLGVNGAAIATVTSVCISFVIYMISIRMKNNPLHAPFREYGRLDFTIIQKIVKTGWPVILHEVFWSLGITLYVVLFSRTNTNAYASYQIASQFMKLTFILAFAVSSAASVTIGIQLGKKCFDQAMAMEKRFTVLQMGVSIASSILMVAIATITLDLFKVEESIKTEAFHMIVVIAFFLGFRFYNGMQAAGILRAGGDTVFPVLYELAGVYLLNIPLLLIGLKYLNISYSTAVAISLLGDIIVSVLLFYRVRSKKWVKNLIGEPAVHKA